MTDYLTDRLGQICRSMLDRSEELMSLARSLPDRSPGSEALVRAVVAMDEVRAELRRAHRAADREGRMTEHALQAILDRMACDISQRGWIYNPTTRARLLAALREAYELDRPAPDARGALRELERGMREAHGLGVAQTLEELERAAGERR